MTIWLVDREFILLPFPVSLHDEPQYTVLSLNYHVDKIFSPWRTDLFLVCHHFTQLVI